MGAGIEVFPESDRSEGGGRHANAPCIGLDLGLEGIGQTEGKGAHAPAS
jgi:hypothetical protein